LCPLTALEGAVRLLSAGEIFTVDGVVVLFIQLISAP